MDTNITIDAGKNLLVLLDKLAEASGVTAAKLYPLYESRIIAHAWAELAAYSISIVLLLACCLGAVYYSSKGKSDATIALLVAVSILSGLILICVSVEAVIYFPDIIVNITSPGPKAINQMIMDARLLIH